MSPSGLVSREDKRPVVPLGLPLAAVEAVGAAVERIRPVVRRHVVLDPVEGEARAGQPVRVAAAHGAEVGEVAGAVVVHGRAAEDDVLAAAVPVGRFEGVQDRPEARDLRAQDGAREHVQIVHRHGRYGAGQ